MSSQDITQRILRYPLDLTGTSPDNYVESEVRKLPNGKNRAIVLSNGAFYTESIKVYDNITGEELTKKVQFTAAQMVEAATVRAGKEICSVLIITDPSVSDEVRVNYQAVGGPYILNVDALVAMIETLSIDDRPITWGAIIGKPDLFPPGHHLHDVGDVFGFEYLVLALEEVRKAIIMGDIASHEEIKAYINDVDQRLTGEIQGFMDALNTHKQDTSNPHNTTKAQVGLGYVDNYATATQAEAEAGAANDKFMTPLRVKQAITLQAGALINAHVNDFNNPHHTTAAQVGLGSVDNFPTATQAEAEAGTANNRFMTPLRVKQAITLQAGALLNAHVSDLSNPHSTTAAQVGLGNVGNYTMATQAEAQAGTAVDRYMNPARTKDAITTFAVSPLTTLINAHAARTDNPHSTTKAQVGLGNVDNYATATIAEATAGTATDRFVTPAGVKAAIAGLTSGGGALGSHIYDYNNPHQTTKSQVGLGNVNNYGTVTDAGTAASSITSNMYMTPQATRWAIDAMLPSYDGRYVKKNANEDTSIMVSGGKIFCYAGGWKQIWPAQWS